MQCVVEKISFAQARFCVLTGNTWQISTTLLSSVVGRMWNSGMDHPPVLTKYLSIDPGQRTGWAAFGANADLLACGIVQNGLLGVAEWLHNWENSYFPTGIVQSPSDITVICETYRVKDWQYKHHMQTIPTIRIIGLLEGFAHIHGMKWVEQESSVYRTGMKWAGLALPKSKSTHIPDHESAIGHGVYYLHKQGLWKIKL